MSGLRRPARQIAVCEAWYDIREFIVWRASDEDIAQRAGLDLITDVPAAAGWLAAAAGPLVLGNHLYADGAS